MICRSLILGLFLLGATAFAQDTNDPQQSSFSQRCLDLMQKHARGLTFRGDGIPKKVEPVALFRYDDVPRGYQDGAVWRLGKEGRPLAIVTTELHPRYGYQNTARSNPCVVYDLVSLAENGFSSASQYISWSPTNSAVKMQLIEDGPKPAETKAKRLIQMRQLARQFKAMQHVDETGFAKETRVLRLLPQNIDRYQPVKDPDSDAAIFLFVAGRMPGIMLFLETKDDRWQFGLGRLSAPSTMTVSYGGKDVWTVGPDVGGSNESYFATNVSAALPRR